jgi:hypothetical protein
MFLVKEGLASVHEKTKVHFHRDPKIMSLLSKLANVIRKS